MILLGWFSVNAPSANTTAPYYTESQQKYKTCNIEVLTFMSQFSKSQLLLDCTFIPLRLSTGVSTDKVEISSRRR